jgi:hypothetical protein
MDMACLLVCDGWPFVHFIQEGERIQTLRSPSVIHSVSVFNMTIMGLNNLFMNIIIDVCWELYKLGWITAIRN